MTAYAVKFAANPEDLDLILASLTRWPVEAVLSTELIIATGPGGRQNRSTTRELRVTVRNVMSADAHKALNGVMAALPETVRTWNWRQGVQI